MTITADMAADDLVEVRCPVDWTTADGGCRPGKLLFLLRKSGEQPSFLHPDNLIMLACPDCKWRARKAGRPVRRVVHAYDFAGELVSTFTESLWAGW